jgi:hypothetical protein
MNRWACVDQRHRSAARQDRPETAGAALAGLADGCPVGTSIEVCCEADDPDLLGLPFEAMALPEGRVLALQSPW